MADPTVHSLSLNKPHEPVKVNMKEKLLSIQEGIMTTIARAAFMAGMGLTFGGLRDFYKVFGWKVRPTHEDFLAKYLRQDIATRIINFPVESLWTDHPEMEGNTQFISAWNDLVDELNVYYWLARADIFAGLGAYALLVIGFDDGKSMDTPVNTDRKNKVTYLQPYLEGSIKVKTLDESPFSPRFGLPVLYEVTPNASMPAMMSSITVKNRAPFTVHYSRVLHLADNCLESQIIGHSRLESIYNTLDDLIKVGGGSAETYWLTANRGLHVDIDKEMELEEDDAQDIADEIDEYEHGLRRVIRTRGTKVQNLGSDVADPRGPFGVLVSLISAATGIPQRVLIGAEAGQLASQQDRANWAVRVDQRISNWGEPKILKPFILTLVAANALPSPGRKWRINWPESFKMNPFERGQTSAQQARSATNVARAMETFQKIGVDGISVEESREMIAPSTQLLVLPPKPVGTFPPKLSAPTNDPKNELDKLEKQGEIQADAAEAAAQRIKDNPELQPQPFGGNPSGNGDANAN